MSEHFLGAPFGGFKQSGLGREECFEEMLAFTQEKNIHVKLRARRLSPANRNLRVPMRTGASDRS